MEIKVICLEVILSFICFPLSHLQIILDQENGEMCAWWLWFFELLLSGFLIALAIISYLHCSQKLIWFTLCWWGACCLFVFINKDDGRSSVFTFLVMEPKIKWQSLYFIWRHRLVPLSFSKVCGMYDVPSSGVWSLWNQLCLGFQISHKMENKNFIRTCQKHGLRRKECNPRISLLQALSCRL